MRRRQVLQLIAGSTGVGLAGCAGLPGDEGGDQPADGNQTEPETPDDVESEESYDDDEDEPKNDLPTIVAFDAEPIDYGTKLRVSLEGEDDQGIERAVINFGDLDIEELPDDTSVVIEEELTDIYEAELDDTPGTVVFTLEDTEGEVTKETHQPHTGSPSVSIESAATPTPGELEVTIEATDEIGLHWLQIAANGESREEIDVTGSDETVHELNLNGDATADGEMNEVTTTVRNTFGRTRSVTQDQYVREFEPLEGQDIEIGTVYLPWFDHVGRWDECTDAEPEVGRYTNRDHEAVSYHADSMEWAGISRLMVNFSVPEGAEPFLERMEQGLPGELPVEVYLEFTGRRYWENKDIEDFAEGLDFVRDNFFSYENYATRDGKPIVSFWDARWLTWGGSEVSAQAKNTIEDTFSHFGEFVEFMRDRLSENGQEPYLIGGMGDHGKVYDEGFATEEAIDLASAFDAVSNWTGKLESGSKVSQEDHFNYMKSNFEGYNLFKEEYGTEFAPMVLPGFDDRSNDCWGEDRYVQRSTDYFRELLDLADDYRTINRINIATWNDWPEGTVLEPGILRGNDHGTDYLEVLQEFVMEEQGR